MGKQKKRKKAQKKQNVFLPSELIYYLNVKKRTGHKQ